MNVSAPIVGKRSVIELFLYRASMAIQLRFIYSYDYNLKGCVPHLCSLHGISVATSSCIQIGSDLSWVPTHLPLNEIVEVRVSMADW
jgi:hypothetical protein